MERKFSAVKRNRGKNVLTLMLFFPISLLFQELITRIYTFGDLTLGQFAYIMLFSLSTGFFISAVISLLRSKTAAVIASVAVTVILTLVYASQTVYYDIFNSYFSWESLGGEAANAIADFSSNMFVGIKNQLVPLLLLFIPLAVLVLIFAYFKFRPDKRLRMSVPLAMLAAASLCFIIPTIAVSADRTDDGAFYLYRYPNDKETAQNFGIITSTRLNISKIIFGRTNDAPVLKPNINVGDNPFLPTSPEDTDAEAPDTEETDIPDKPIVYGDNVMDIDFESLIANAPNSTIKDMHSYFSQRTPTKKNEYTGIFEGKNLIMLTLEGFSGKVIDPNLTPTLYKMANQGFVFNNFYCSCWGGSTATGEYANTTGNFYNKASCHRQSSENYMPFALGTQLGKLGYNTLAYHGHTHTFYNRDVFLANMGYDYLGIGNGLENLMDSDGNTIKKAWPRSDHEVAKVTVDQFIGNQPFHVYYMTISGHANYNWGGNAMSKKHRQEVQHLQYSEEVKAYIACQLEVELMLTELVNQLEEKGILEDTVFVMSADHYPFGLSKEALSELYGISRDNPENVHKYLDLYKSALVIWSSSMEEPITVDTPCSAIDILPTVSNLFGIEYDSRLMMGVDVFSGTDPIVIVNGDGNGSSWNWVNRFGVYNTANGKFTVSDGFTASKDEIKKYVSEMNSVIKTMRSYSYKILTEDYYKYVFGK